MATFHKLLGENYDAHQVFSHHSSRESGPFGISEDTFIYFAELHATMKKTREKW
jgi:hypothetical protein